MPYQKQAKADSRAAEKRVEAARKRFELCEAAEAKARKIALEDLKFRAGDQWPEDIRTRREKQSKPCLTINILPARERQILNDQRQNEKAIKVSPVDSSGDPKTAEILQGIIRHIEYDSNAKAAWDNARAFQVRIGFGFVLVDIDYESPQSLNKVIKIRRIVNPFSVYMDPTCQEPDYSDAGHASMFEVLTKDEYQREYPKSKLATNDWRGLGDIDPKWISEADGIRIVEQFYREMQEDVVLRLRGPAGEADVLKSQMRPEVLRALKSRKLKVVDQRETEIPVIRWCKFNAIESIDETTWPGQWIPIVPVLGDELHVEGERVLEGMIRHTKDAVRMNNYMASAMVQAIGLAPNAPYVMAEGQDAGHEREWQTANDALYSRLIYKPISVANTLVPEPKRNIAEPPIQAVVEARQLFGQDIKDITGIYDAQLGNRSNEVSGRGIEARKLQGELANLHFADNESTARRHVGRIIIDLIPKIYSEARVMRIIGDDGTQKTVQVNASFDDGGIKRIYDLTTGRYDVTVSDGPSYETKRQEAAESMLDMVKSYPELMHIAGDLLVKNLDFPGADDLAKRIKKTLAPELQDDDDSSPEALLAQMQSKFRALVQQHELLTATVEKQNQIIQQKQIEQQTQIETAKLRAEAQITAASITTKAQEMNERLGLVVDMLKEFHASAHERAMQAEEHSQQSDLADQQAANASAQSAQDAAQAAETED